jgi:hypothetical protein
MMDVLFERPAPQTGSELIRFVGLITLYAQDAIVLYV